MITLKSKNGIRSEIWMKWKLAFVLISKEILYSFEYYLDSFVKTFVACYFIIPLMKIAVNHKKYRDI